MLMSCYIAYQRYAFLHICVCHLVKNVCFSHSLEQFGQLEQLGAIASFYKYVKTFRTVTGNFFFYFLHITELAEATFCLSELVAHKPYIVYSSRLKEVRHLTVFLPASRMSPSIAILGDTSMSRKLARAAAILVGLALYVSTISLLYGVISSCERLFSGL